MKVLVTGASSAIGRSIAENLSQMGDELCLHYCSHPPKSVGNMEAIKADLLEALECEKLVHRAHKILEGLDGLVICAGDIFGSVPFAELSLDDWNRTLALNLTAPFLVARAAFELMKVKGGRIVFISSISAKYSGGENSLHYAAAKTGSETVMKGLAKQGAQHGILVNTIRPGFIDTPFHARMGRSHADIQRRISLIPLGRAGMPKDISQLVSFLMGPGGDFITGEVFTVAGGD